MNPTTVRLDAASHIPAPSTGLTPLRASPPGPNVQNTPRPPRSATPSSNRPLKSSQPESSIPSWESNRDCEPQQPISVTCSASAGAQGSRFCKIGCRTFHGHRLAARCSQMFQKRRHQPTYVPMFCFYFESVEQKLQPVNLALHILWSSVICTRSQTTLLLGVVRDAGVGRRRLMERQKFATAKHNHTCKQAEMTLVCCNTPTPRRRGLRDGVIRQFRKDQILRDGEIDIFFTPALFRLVCAR